MTKLPLVSIITPSYNQAPYLEETILSVLNQDYPHIEYIIIDGGSTDGSVDIIRKYADRLAYWSSESDSGQAEAINKGWRRCQGDLIAYLNSDDYYLPGAISTIVATWQAHPESGVICGQATWVDVRGNPQQTTSSQVNAQQMLNRLESLPQPAAFVTKAVVERIGFFDEGLHYTLDKEYYLRAVANADIAYATEPLACMRLHESSKSVAATSKFAPEMVRLAKKITTAPTLYPRCAIVPSVVFSRAHIVAAQFLYISGAFRAAGEQLFHAFRLSPAYRWQIATRELPRLILRMFVGRNRYANMSALLRNAQQKRAAAMHTATERTR